MSVFQFSARYPPGIRVPRRISTLLFVAATITQNSGKTQKSDMIVNNIFFGARLNNVLCFLLTLITYLHLDKCDDCRHQQNEHTHCTRIAKVRHVDKRGIVNVMCQ